MAHSAELPLLAGLSMQAWGQGYSQVGAALGIGQLTKAEGFERILRDGGVEPRPDLVRALVDRDRELLLRSARLYDDALEFLRDVRARGIKIAIVSNCSEHTRDLLESNGVAELADTLVLSCEVGAEKPAAEIFTHALDQLGVPARHAVFVDDQPAFCAAAVGPGHHRGADRAGRAGREGAGAGHRGGPLAVGRGGDVLSLRTAARDARGVSGCGPGCRTGGPARRRDRW